MQNAEGSKPKQKFSTFFKSLVIELDKELYGPDNHLVEVRKFWIKRIYIHIYLIDKVGVLCIELPPLIIERTSSLWLGSLNTLLWCVILTWLLDGFLKFC